MVKSEERMYMNDYMSTTKTFYRFEAKTCGSVNHIPISHTLTIYSVVHLFKKWKRSIFKLIWHELLTFLALFFALSLIYR